jgi:hypothetical protein
MLEGQWSLGRGSLFLHSISDSHGRTAGRTGATAAVTFVGRHVFAEVMTELSNSGVQ